MNKILFISALAAVSSLGFGQAASITSFTATPYSGGVSTGGYTQDFDVLGTTDATLTYTGANPALAGTFASMTAGSTEWSYGISVGGTGFTGANNATFKVDNGSSSTGQFKNYGTTSATDRALGTLSANAFTGNAGIAHLGLRVKNSTTTSTGLAIVAFTMEQWRAGGNVLGDSMKISFSLYKAGGPSYAALDLTDESKWSNLVDYQLATDSSYSTLGAYQGSNTVQVPIAGGTAVALDGNNSANQKYVRAALNLNSLSPTGLGNVWEDGDELVIRFSDQNPANADSGFAVDNLQVVPEPASMAIIGVGLAGLVAKRRRK